MSLTPLQIATLVERYTRERDRFEKMAGAVARHLSAALRNAAVPHVPTFRAKLPENLRGKLERDTNKHDISSFEREFAPSILDLAGVRILLYRPGDAEPVCDEVERVFYVPPGDRFTRHHANDDGYQAHHRVVMLRRSTIASDPDLGNLVGVYCEVQVVTIGDHIWNELEHDIKYKTPDGEPSSVQGALLHSLRGQLNLVRDTVGRLMDATDKCREENLTEIETPDDLQHALKARSGRLLRGDLGRLLELLDGVLREVTRAQLQRLPLAGPDLDTARDTLCRAQLPVAADDPVLVVAALWKAYGPEFTTVVGSWMGKPGPVSRAVRALDQLAKSE